MSLDFDHEVSASISFSGNLFWRENDTDAFNGDGTEFAVCGFAGGDGLVKALKKTMLRNSASMKMICARVNSATPRRWRDFLNTLATSLGEDDEYNIEGFEDDELSGTGVLTDDAINNISNRVQQSFGGDFQWTLTGTLASYYGQIVLGGSYFNGESDFRSVLELSKSIRSRALLPVSAPEPSLTTQQL